MKLNFYGAAGMVTGSSYLLEISGYRLLIDCGMFQGSKAVKELNYGAFPYDTNSLDAIILTHAHIDHSGLIPKLIKNGYHGPVYATPETIELCSVMFPDSGHIQEMEVGRKNRKFTRSDNQLLNPIYTAEDGLNALKSFIPVRYDESLLLSPDITARFLDAGHILGSSHVLINMKEGEKTTKLVFSGDIGSNNQPFIEDPSKIEDADIIVMETTYGDRLHEDKDKREEILAEVINDAWKRGGNIVIPAFAIERTQDIIYYLHKLQIENKIPVIPTYVDSPLAVAATRIFSRNTRNFDDESTELIENGNNPFTMKNLHFSETTADSIELNNISQPSIIISASGMADAGRIKHHLKHNLWRPNATVIFVGYQAEESLGRRLIDGVKEVIIHGERIAVKANIVRLPSFSAHADQNELLNWVKVAGKNARHIILVHGEEESMNVFSGLIEQNLGKTPIVPVLGESLDFRQDEVFRKRPEVPWLKEIEDRLAQQKPSESTAAPKSGRPVRHRRLPGKGKTTAADVNRSYTKLRANLNTVVQTAKRERDYSSLLEIFERINKMLEESIYKR